MRAKSWGLGHTYERTDWGDDTHEHEEKRVLPVPREWKPGSDSQNHGLERNRSKGQLHCFVVVLDISVVTLRSTPSSVEREGNGSEPAPPPFCLGMGCVPSARWLILVPQLAFHSVIHLAPS